MTPKEKNASCESESAKKFKTLSITKSVLAHGFKEPMLSPGSPPKFISASAFSNRRTKTPKRISLTTMTLLYPNANYVRHRSPMATIPKTKKPLNVFIASGNQTDDPGRPITYVDEIKSTNNNRGVSDIELTFSGYY
jgi:hypothetical protein